MKLRCVVASLSCIALVVTVAGCGPRAEGPAGPDPAPVNGDENGGGGGGGGNGGGGNGGEEGQDSEEISLTSPRVVLGPTVSGTCATQTSEGQAGPLVVVVEVPCLVARTTVTIRNDGSEAVAGATLQGTLVFDSPPAEPVTASASSSGGECSGTGTSFSCTLNIEPGSSTEVVVTYTRPPSVLVARFDLALTLAFAT